MSPAGEGPTAKHWSQGLPAPLAGGAPPMDIGESMSSVNYFALMGAAVDCELIRSGFFGQPVNTITTLGFFIAGSWLLWRPMTKWAGVALVATGFGSLVFHGPMPSWGDWAHDVSLAWLILVAGGLGTRWERWSRLPGLALLAALFAVSPLSADPVTVALAVIVIASIVLRREGRRTLAPLALLGAVAVLGRLGATDWPLCDPRSVWQLHGLWHVGAALAVVWWAMTARRPLTDPRHGPA